MAAGTIEGRLRRLEDAHSIHNADDIDSALVCNASLLHTEQISALGTEYNNLEEAIHALELANNDREQRVRRLEQQIRTTADMYTEDSNATESIAGPEMANGSAALSSAPPAREAEVSKSARDDIARRLQELEQNQTSSLSSFSTHEIAQHLLIRLGNGDMLEPIVQRQLKSSLSGESQQPPTPSLTISTRGESTVSATTAGESHAQRVHARVLKRKVDRSMEDEPPSKRPRGRLPKNRLSDSSATGQLPKRARGRPAIHGRYSRKSSYESVSSNALSPTSSSRTPSPDPGRGRTSFEETSVPVKSKNNQEDTVTVEDELVGEGNRLSDNGSELSSLNSDVSKSTLRLPSDRTPASDPGDVRKAGSNSTLVTTNGSESKSSTSTGRLAVLIDDGSTQVGDRSSSEPIAVASRAQSLATPKEKSVPREVDGVSNSLKRNRGQIGYSRAKDREWQRIVNMGAEKREWAYRLYSTLGQASAKNLAELLQNHSITDAKARLACAMYQRFSNTKTPNITTNITPKDIAVASDCTSHQYDTSLVGRIVDIDSKYPKLHSGSMKVLNERAATHSHQNAYRDMTAPCQSVMEESTENIVNIPPERRSARRPMPTRPFGDVVSWKEANAQIDGLRPSAP